MPLAVDLLHPTLREEKRKCKLKRLVPSPNSFFMDVKCPGRNRSYPILSNLGCLKIQIVFSHAQTPVVCPGCDRILCQPTGGRTRLANGCSYRKKTR
ncbi:Ribosomal protein S27 [Fasciola hepatica]|uniref:Ribosomal protein S27 n=2 Tax=Fasciola TaxID=6191 RepID=A0A4E0RYQ8_FASHE|nr:Ribosomal protein S27 [Fasciola hepatica]